MLPNMPHLASNTSMPVRFHDIVALNTQRIPSWPQKKHHASEYDKHQTRFLACVFPWPAATCSVFTVSTRTSTFHSSYLLHEHQLTWVSHYTSTNHISHDEADLVPLIWSRPCHSIHQLSSLMPIILSCLPHAHYFIMPITKSRKKHHIFRTRRHLQFSCCYLNVCVSIPLLTIYGLVSLACSPCRTDADATQEASSCYDSPSKTTSYLHVAHPSPSLTFSWLP